MTPPPAKQGGKKEEEEQVARSLSLSLSTPTQPKCCCRPLSSPPVLCVNVIELSEEEEEEMM